jgi:hypothetical protein
MRRFLLALALSAACSTLGATELPQAERQSILGAARPVAARKAGQPIRIKIDRLNVDRHWAVLVGSLVSATGKGIDWSLAKNCNPELDKMLWVVLQKSKEVWTVKHIEICAPEPPYWNLEQYGGLIWPCGVYSGLETGEDETLEDRCRNQVPRPR